ncbi:capsular polysaccharide export protein, LipB/KpsS family [Psychrobacter celer]|uniref:capsular polysaccharide export protein, LipB/KpsS family n=1 Tax=Psychrobacter celer TaxID=306572 RepID=UPI003FD3F667
MADKSLFSMFSIPNLKNIHPDSISDKVLNVLPLDKIKLVYKLAIRTNNSALQEKCIAHARTRFPQNTFSYIEEAKTKIKYEKFNEAWKILNKAPHNKEINALKKNVALKRNVALADKEKPSLAYLDIAELEDSTLIKLKKVHSSAVDANNVRLQEECIARAITDFPENTFGYVEEAKIQIQRRQFNDAWKVLTKSPNSKTVESLKQKILSYDGAHLTTMLEEEIMRIGKLIKLKPLNSKYYDDYILFLSELGKNKEVEKLIKWLPVDVDSFTMKTRFAIIASYLDLGDQKSALDHLLLMQKKYMMDRRVLHRISDIYKFDKQTDRAYSYLLLGEQTYPIYGAIRRLTFESDHNMIDNGNETLDRVLDFKEAELARFLSMINRVSCFYPERKDELVECRIKVRRVIIQNILKNNSEFNKNLKFLLANRWFADAMEFMSQGLELGFHLDENVSALYKKIEKNLVYSDSKNIIAWLEIADQNERSDVLLGIMNGFPVDVNKVEREAVKIELFIPSAFFTPPEKEKPSFKTAQEYFRAICEIVSLYEDVIVIPRHQYHWKNVHRKTDFKAISYHTFNEVDNPNWLHVQESTLAGRCSVDTQGFAGYSKMANDFSKIEEYTSNIDQSTLDENFNYLYQEYVVNNVSKYHQNEKAFVSEGEYVFVALQVLTDIVADIAFFDGIQMLKTIAEYYKNTATKVVVKRHPYCNSLSMQVLIETLVSEGSIVVSDASIHNIIANAKAVFVVNSGVGFESLMHLKPVVVCGQCDYAYAVSNQVKTPTELLRCLETDNFSVNEKKVKKLLYYYANIYNPKLEKLPALLKEWINN